LSLWIDGETFPGRSAARSGALQTRDRNERRVQSDPGSAVQHSLRSRRTASGKRASWPGFVPAISFFSNVAELAELKPGSGLDWPTIFFQSDTSEFGRLR
jgi:hypothetical protein